MRETAGTRARVGTYCTAAPSLSNNIRSVKNGALSPLPTNCGRGFFAFGDIINLDNKPPISIIAISNNETAAIQ